MNGAASVGVAHYSLKKNRHGLEQSGYADFCLFIGQSDCTMKFQWKRMVCFFVRVPDAFSGLKTLMRSANERMISY